MWFQDAVQQLNRRENRDAIAAGINAIRCRSLALVLAAIVGGASAFAVAYFRSDLGFSTARSTARTVIVVQDSPLINHVPYYPALRVEDPGGLRHQLRLVDRSRSAAATRLGISAAQLKRIVTIALAHDGRITIQAVRDSQNDATRTLQAILASYVQERRSEIAAAAVTARAFVLARSAQQLARLAHVSPAGASDLRKAELRAATTLLRRRPAGVVVVSSSTRTPDTTPGAAAAIGAVAAIASVLLIVLLRLAAARFGRGRR
jgi:hypothetical protein